MVTHYLYDDVGRVVRTVTASPWTDEDRALMLAYRMHLDSLCRCGHPKSKAWHWDNDGFYEVEREFTCHACTAKAQAAAEGSGQPVQPVKYAAVVDTRDYEAKPLPPFDLSALTPGRR